MNLTFTELGEHVEQVRQHNRCRLLKTAMPVVKLKMFDAAMVKPHRLTRIGREDQERGPPMPPTRSSLPHRRTRAWKTEENECRTN